MNQYKTLSGEIIEYPTPAPEVAAFLAQVMDAAHDPMVTEAELTALIYGKMNPLLDQDTLPSHGVVTKATFANPIYHVMIDLLGRKRVQVGTLDMARAEARYTMTVAEAAEQLEVHPSAVRQAIHAHKLAAQKRGGAWLLDPNAVESYRVSRRGPKGPALRVIGASSSFRIKPQLEVKDDPVLHDADGRPFPRTVRGIIREFERAAVISGSKGNYRMFILEPDEQENSFEGYEGGEIRGRFKIVEKINNPRKASERWREFEAS